MKSLLRRAGHAALFILVLMAAAAMPGLTGDGTAAAQSSAIYSVVVQAPDEGVTAVLSEPCTACNFAGKLIVAADSFAAGAFERLRDPIAKVVNYTFALWVLLQGMYLMLGMGDGRNPGAILWGLVTRSATFFVVIGLLHASGSQTFWDRFYNLPIQEAANGASLLSTAAGGGSPVAGCSISAPTGTKIDSGTVKQMLCLVEKVEKSNRLGMVFGYYLFANFQGTLLDIFGKFLFALFMGTVIIVVFALGTIYFTFFVVDVFLRIAFLTAFAPFFIAFFLFGPTRQYAMKAIAGFVSALFSIMAASAVYGFSSTLVLQIPSVYFGSAAGGAGTGGGGGSAGDQFTRMLAEMSYDNFELLASYVWFAIIAGAATILLTRQIAGEIASIFGTPISTTMADKAVGVASMAGGLAKSAVGAAGGAFLFGSLSGTLRGTKALSQIAANGIGTGMLNAAGSAGIPRSAITAAGSSGPSSNTP